MAIKRIGYKATKNVMTDALVDSLTSSQYGNLLKQGLVESVSVVPSGAADSLPEDPKDLRAGEEGRFEIYLPAYFFRIGWSDKFDKQRNHEYEYIPPTPQEVEGWLNENLEGVRVTVDRLNREDKVLVYADDIDDYLEMLGDSAEADIDELEDTEELPPLEMYDYTVEGNVVVAKSLLKGALRRYKAYQSGYKAATNNNASGINPYRRTSRSVKQREFENVYEALQELQVQAGNANLSGPVSILIADMAADGISRSDLAVALGVFTADLERIVEQRKIDPYMFAAEIAEVLADYSSELREIP